MKTPITQNNFIVPYHIHNGIDSPKLNIDTSTSFQALTGIIKATGSFAGGTFTPNDSAGVSISVPGAKLGDYVLSSLNVDLNSIIMTAYVSAIDTVFIHFTNNSNGVSFTVAPGTIYISVISNP